MDLAQIFAAAVLIISYALIISEKIHRTVVALAGGILIIALGPSVGLINKSIYPTGSSFVAEAVDWNTIGLLLGMMIIIGILKDTGIFEFIAVKTAKLSKGDPVKIILLFAIITAIVSAFLDNVTTVLLMAPVTISIAKKLDMNPVPFLISEIFASNIGGTATLIGDPPNMIISSGAGLSFNEFIIHLTPIIFFVLIFSLVFLKYAFREQLSKKPENIKEILNMNEWDMIKDYRLLKKSIFVIFIVIILFFLQSWLHLEPSTVALFGAALLLIITHHHPDKALRQVEWSVLLFFAGIFIIVKGVEEAGLIQEAASIAVNMTHGNLIGAMFVILWTSAIISAIVDNIPFTVAMVPLVESMSSSPALASQIAHLNTNPLWWALALGACLGGNGTLIGASANIVVSGISERMGHPISFKEFFKYGAPLTFISIFISGLFLYVEVFII